MTDVDNNDIAIAIEDARRRVALVEQFTAAHPLLDLDDAYGIMLHASVLRSTSSGARPVGRKIGFTNRTIWERYGVYGPIWGWMYDDSMELLDGTEGVVVASTLCQPRTEPEIVFRLADDIAPGAGVDEVAQAIEWVAFGFEVVQCHYPDWKLTAVDSIIDASLHGASRVGPRVTPWPTMVSDLATFSLKLLKDGAVIDEGRGSNVLDSPLHALVHLAATASVPLHAGEVITTGTVTDAAWAHTGDSFTVEIDGLPLEPITLTYQ
jgi:2-oxo-3-hexenedioate decarboxylase